MAIVASLDIVMRAQTDQANNKLMKSADVLGKLRNALAGAAAAYFSFSAAQRAFSNTLQGLVRVDELAETAEKLGMSATSLRILGNAADMTGSSMASLTAAMAIMQRNIGNALSAKGATIFDRLGVSVRELMQLSPDQQFIKISKAISELESKEEQLAAAQAVFGKGAKDLILLIRDVSSAVADSAEFIKRFGGELSDLDVARISVAQDAWDMLRHAISMAWEVLATKFAPELAALAGFITRIVELFIGFGNVLRVVFDSGIGKVVAFSSAVAVAYTAIPLLTAAVYALGTAFIYLFSAQAGWMALTSPATWLLIADAVGIAAVAYKMMEEELDKVSEKVDKLTAKQGIVNRTPRLKFQFDDVADQISKKVVTVRVNPQFLEQGSPEEVTRRLAVDLKVEKDVQKQQLDAQNNSNQILLDILEEMKKQTDQITGDADL